MWWPRFSVLLGAAWLLLAWRAIPQAAPQGASLEVRTVPSGAEVLIDSAPAGQTNLTLEHQKTGPAEVLVRRVGYKPARQRVTLDTGRTTLLSFELDPEPQSVQLKVQGPEHYTVEVGPGQPQSYRDPKKLLLVPGRYELTGHADGYKELRQKLEVKPGADRQVSLEFSSQPQPTPVPTPPPQPPAPQPPAYVPPPPRPAYVPPPAPRYYPPPRPYVPPVVPRPVFTPVAPPPIAPVLTPLP